MNTWSEKADRRHPFEDDSRDFRAKPTRREHANTWNEKAGKRYSSEDIKAKPTPESSRKQPKNDEYRTHRSTHKSSEADAPKSRQREHVNTWSEKAGKRHSFEDDSKDFKAANSRVFKKTS